MRLRLSAFQTSHMHLTKHRHLYIALVIYNVVLQHRGRLYLRTSRRIEHHRRQVIRSNRLFIQRRHKNRERVARANRQLRLRGVARINRISLYRICIAQIGHFFLRHATDSHH